MEKAVKYGAVTAEEALLKYGRHIEQTSSLVNKLGELGWMFVVGNNAKLNEAKRWRGFDLARITRTSSALDSPAGKTLWAVRQKTH